jgi:hypothetical protein
LLIAFMRDKFGDDYKFPSLKVTSTWYKGTMSTHKGHKVTEKLKTRKRKKRLPVYSYRTQRPHHKRISYLCRAVLGMPVWYLAS